MRAKFLLLLCFAGCATMNTLNTNMSTMNDTIQVNTEVSKGLGPVIMQNTAEVTRSTNQAAEFKKIISHNTEQMKGGVEGAKKHGSLLPIAFIAFIALLFLPTAICLIFYAKFFQHLRSSR